MNSNQNIPNGRSTSRIKNATRSQGFANKDLYGSAVKHKNASGTNQRRQYHRPPRRNVQNNNGEISESTIVKIIVGSILAAVLLAIIIIIALVIMNFQI